MILQPMTKQEETDLTVPFRNDLVMLLNEVRKEIKNRIENASSSQEALEAVSVLDEPLEED